MFQHSIDILEKFYQLHAAGFHVTVIFSEICKGYVAYNKEGILNEANNYYTTLTNFSTKYLTMCKVYTDVGGIK